MRTHNSSMRTKVLILLLHVSAYYCMCAHITMHTELCTLLGHTAEIVSLSFNQAGDKLITGSFDHTTKLWDVKSGRCIHTFQVLVYEALSY
jgi:WD40 repeat protein